MRWDYTYISSLDMMSGWKFYIFGRTISDSKYVAGRITPVCERYNCTVKIATEAIIQRNTLLKPAWGVAVIYLHPEMFGQQLVNSLIRSIDVSLYGYSNKGCYTGSKHLINSISYRYDLNIPIKPEVGLTYDDYIQYYRGEFGYYNIPQNNDINLINLISCQDI